MHRFLVACCAALLSACDGQPPVATGAPAEAGTALRVQNIADDFVAVYDTTAGQPPDARVAAFRRDVAAQFPAFYAIERFDGRHTQEEDARITKAFEQFPRIRDAYVDKVAQFDRELDRNVGSFRTAFPGFELSTPIVLLHSLGELDGGTRDLAGETYLLFGADVMAWVHDWDDEAPFFHHELFHVHHDRFFEECDALWCALWAEGLAVYVASVLNPEAGEPALLLAWPDNMAEATRRQLKASLAHLQTVLSSTDESVYSALFNAAQDHTGLPPRRGYYLGYLVARELARDRNLSELAELSNEDAAGLVERAVAALLSREPNG